MFNNFETGREPIATDTETISTLEEAQKLVRTNRFEDALQHLDDKGLLAEQMERVKAQYEDALSNPELNLRELDWGMLTILELYDADTVEHSVRVYQNAVYALQRPLVLEDGSPFILNDYLAEEGVTKRDFLHAALFHDIGKTLIPHDILKDRTTKDEFDRCFCEQAELKGSAWLEAIGVESTEDSVAALDALYEQHKRPLDVLPLVDVIGTEKYTKLQTMFPYIEINEQTTFRDILVLHEGESERILKVCGELISATIAGQHHNYANSPLVYPRATSTLRLARAGVRSKLSDMLHIIDVSDAIRHARSYKDAQDEYRVLHELIADTRAGRIDSPLAHAWIQAEYEKIISSPHELITPEDLTSIQEFLVEPAATTVEMR